ncbi:MAG: InlB B-repeat-containing protein [Planctomycetes bacterium]|nr:InlB B-repeat-containing protein [Planctomycetota bacterium]
MIDFSLIDEVLRVPYPCGCIMPMSLMSSLRGFRPLAILLAMACVSTLAKADIDLSLSSPMATCGAETRSAGSSLTAAWASWSRKGDAVGTVGSPTDGFLTPSTAPALAPAVQAAIDARMASPSGTITVLPEGARIDHPGHQVQARIDGQGLGLDGARIALRGVGRAGSGVTAVGSGEVRASADHVVLWRPLAHEVYTTSPAGVRHDVVIEQRPAGAGDLVVEIACTGGHFAAKDEAGAELILADRRLTYDRLLVTDTDGRRLSAVMSVVDGAVRIAVADAGARYPVVVDPTISTTGSMGTARLLHTATVLQSGKVLVTGGISGSFALASCEVYDPTAGTWSATGFLATGRYSHTATLLPSGKVLVTGGYDFHYNTEAALASCELYDPTTGTWSFTVSLANTRYAHTATLLPSGKVLVTGGFNRFSYLASCEVYDPMSGTWWSITGSLATARSSHTATLLSSGKVLVTGGFGSVGYLASCEVYDPTTGTWAATGSLATARKYHTATLMPSGKVLVAGGYVTNLFLSSCEVYDPTVGTWSATGSLATARDDHTTTLLPSGKVLAVGGYVANLYLSSCEVYDPTAGTWSATGSLATARSSHAATLLPSGKVLVTGGVGSSMDFYLSSCEVYDLPGVSYWANGATGGSAPAYQAKALGVSLTLSTSGSLVRTGYAFAGWNTAADGSGTPYAAGASYTMDESLMLYAQWAPASRPGDLNGDKVVNVSDLSLVTAHFGQTSSDANWDARADANGDGVVNVADLTQVTSNFGKTY